jgi:hypothetical protein
VITDHVSPGLRCGSSYDWSGRTIEYHRAQVRKFRGFSEPTAGDEDRLADWLAAGICPMEMSRDRLRSALLARCREVRIEPPKTTRIERVLGAPRRCSSGSSPRRLQELKEDPGPFQLGTLLAEIVKLERVKAIGLPVALFEGVSEKVVAGWRARAMKMYPSDFESAPLPIRITLLAALCQVRQAELTDGLVELLVQLVHKISVRAEKKVEGEISAEFRRVHGKNGILVKLATAALALPEEIVRKAPISFSPASRLTLRPSPVASV